MTMEIVTGKMIDLCIHAHSSAAILPGLQTLLARGFTIQARIGGTLSDLLGCQLGIGAEYLTNRVQTLFLNNSPVDDPEKTAVAEGDVIALSAAMPGLAGATLRKGGFYSRLRHGISHQAKDAKEIDQHKGIVTIRLFNVVAKELGPLFLERGVMVDAGTLQSFFKIAGPVLTSPAYTFILDGEEISIQALLENDWLRQKVRLRIQAVGGTRR
jgi:hypothetical protein